MTLNHWQKIQSLAGYVLSCMFLLCVGSLQAGTDTWTKIGAGSPPHENSVLALLQDPTDPAVFYAAVESQGVFKSVDGGKTWNKGNGARIGTIEAQFYLDPQDRNVLYATSINEGLYKSIDGGSNWTLLTGFFSGGVNAIAFDPRNSATVYLCYDSSTGGLTNSGIVKSTDGGATWKKLNVDLFQHRFVALAMDPQRPDVLYAVDSINNALLKTSDGGAHWDYFGQRLNTSTSVPNNLVVDPRDSNILYYSGSYPFKSIDGGQRWELISLRPASEYDGAYALVTLDPRDRNVVYAMEAFRAFKSQDAGGNWSSLNTPLATSCLLVDSHDPRTVYIGTGLGIFAMTITHEVPPSLRIRYPKGGESWEAGGIERVSIISTADIWDVKIEISFDGGATYSLLGISAAGDARIDVPSSPSSSVRIRVTDPISGVSDVSDADLSIVARAARHIVTIDSPVAGAQVNGKFLVKASVSGNLPVAQVDFFIDDNRFGSSFQPPYQAEWNSQFSRNGTHRMRVAAYAQLPGSPSGESEINVLVSNPEPLDPQSLLTMILPSSARAPGLGGAFYTTDLAVSNPSAAGASFTMKFLSHDADGTAGPEKQFLIEGGKTVTFHDVLKSVFGLESDYGAILIRASNQDLRASGQTWTSGAGGTFGQSVPTVHDPMVNSDFATLSGFIAGIREDSAFRTNLILVNLLSNAPTEVRVTLHDPAGSLAASRNFTLPPLGMTQVTRVVRELGIPTDVAGWQLRLSPVSLPGALLAYASVIDNVTNDPRTLLARTTNSWLLPSSARVGGVSGAFFTTDVTIVNAGSLAAHGTLWFLGHDRDGRQSPAYRFALAPRATLSLPDVLQSAFGLDSGFGAILLTSNELNLSLSGQTSTPGAGGTFGQSVPASGALNSLVAPLLERSVFPIREDNEFRTNLILANAVQTDAVVTVSLFSADGKLLARQEITLPPLGMTQIGRVVRSLGTAEPIQDARITVSTTTPGAFVAGYASVIDNVTNDPRTLLLR